MEGNIRRYGFAAQLAYSKQQRGSTRLVEILGQRIPGYTQVVMAETSDDLQGTDYWVTRNGVPALSVDLKARREDCLTHGNDDLALETWSKKPVAGQQGRAGWTRDSSKWTDYVVWYWEDTGRFFIVPFPPLCAVFSRRWERWSQTYRVATQQSDSWQSECVFVPRVLVQRSIEQWASGSVKVQ